MLDEKVRTPCIGTCSTVFGDYVCRGCKRFMQEIIDWNGYSETEKRAVEGRLDQLLARVVNGKLEVIDDQAFSDALGRWRVKVSVRRHQAVAAFELLRLSGRRLESFADAGLRPLAPYRDFTPHAMKELIDREFFVLSEAYYDRYIRPHLKVNDH